MLSDQLGQVLADTRQLEQAIGQTTERLTEARGLELEQLRLALAEHPHDYPAAVRYTAALQLRLRGLRDYAWRTLETAFPEESQCDS